MKLNTVRGEIVSSFGVLILEKRHKNSAASILLNRALSLSSTSERNSKEVIHVKNSLKWNEYRQMIISYVSMKKPPLEITPSPEEVGTFFKWADPSDSNRDFAVLPYINGLTEPLARLLRETTEFELQVDLSRPYNRFFSPSQDRRPIYEQMSFNRLSVQETI